MARKPRVHYEKAIYHVIARGNNKDRIFLDSEDKYKYLDLVDRYRRKYNFEIYAYVLMDNHIHLLICVNDTPLSKIMQGIQQTYTSHFNRKYQHVGHVFQQRYKAILCDNDAYLLKLVCYIHQNPCRANLPDQIGYAWSSHADYMAGHGRTANPTFILHMFSGDIRQAIQLYAEMIPQEQTDPSDIMKKLSGYESSEPTPIEYVKTTDISGEKQTFEEFTYYVAEEMQVPLEQLLGKCRIRKVVEARNILIYRVVESEVCTRAELAKKLGLDPAAITRGYQRVKASMAK
ncbi:hypothetical protein SPSIL_042210 [Sporomusa silvacetica DSM 10669]|uniref:Transposase IS200 like protein n=1 Tax=Sporomusa silvacetica DSM 10669 TaxID=1123289 RepID=A0ABZ3IQP8_9FIRM|nr:transposase [Sporomusa silvacetica]OZC20482.1 transposase IS200 like protein [Sporomusa silvacetica DSM 10669]